MTLNYLLYFCTPAKISIIFKYEHITPKKWMRLVKPKKALGQHFLKDLQIAERIADTLSDYKQLPVLEIGPGMGVLTQFLLEKGHDLTVVELDMESVDYLEQNFPVLEGKILAEDFLRLDLGKLFPDQFCVIGNYPYNISSQIFFKVLGGAGTSRSSPPDAPYQTDSGLRTGRSADDRERWTAAASLHPDS